MTNIADLMYDTRPPPPNKSRIILGDGSTKKKVEFIGKIDLIFHSKTKIPATLYYIRFVPGLWFNIFSFDVVQENQERILNIISGAHLMNGRLTFRASKLLSGKSVDRSMALIKRVLKVAGLPPFNVFAFSLPPTAAPPPQSLQTQTRSALEMRLPSRVVA